MASLEGGVPNLPHRVAALAGLDDAALRMGELVEGRNDLALPNFVPVQQRETEDDSLDELPGHGQIVQILLRHRIDPVPRRPSKMMNCSAAGPASASGSGLMP
jgi:hypothetical protein